MVHLYQQHPFSLSWTALAAVAAMGVEVARVLVG